VEVVGGGLVDVPVEEELGDPVEDKAGWDRRAADDVLQGGHGENVCEEKGGQVDPVAELHSGRLRLWPPSEEEDGGGAEISNECGWQQTKMDGQSKRAGLGCR
jgi:hypothetical protein